jgi:(1->4)-alpha-D-glucan 1-alpha-D-glucosylmutase
VARIPVATYRLQLNAGCTLADAAALVDYLADLGISDLYLSPIQAARAGSRHGYDVVDHARINPDLGDEDDLRRLAAAARARGMGILLDVVPNHMCIADRGNAWWNDVLENGPSSPCARHFDIAWHPAKPDLADKVLLPFLGDQYGRVLESGGIHVEYEAGAFVACCGGSRYPVAPRSIPHILEPALGELRAALGEHDASVLEMESILTALGHLPLRSETDRAKVRERLREKEVGKRRLAALAEGSADVRRALARSLAELNGRPGEPRSFDRLEALLADQAYRLSYWRVAADEINYRRFFDQNDLAAIRVEELPVFSAVHALPLRLIAEGAVTGLRIDHVDGLLRPAKYLGDLQRAARTALADAARRGAAHDDAARDDAQPMYVVVEKILGGGERLRGAWPVAGTTGYEFLNELNGILVDPAEAGRMREVYARFTGEAPRFADVVHASKKLILDVALSSELGVLARRLDRISEQHRYTRDFTLNSLQGALAELIACFPVYRTYLREDDTPETIDPEDRRHIEAAVAIAKRRNPAVDASLFEFLGDVLLLADPDGLEDADRGERREFVLRFQQLTAPVTAKGVEDTAFYRFYPLASLNEVGGDPLAIGTPLARFHRRQVERAHAAPHALSATSTHDTKRSEDVRARIDVLAEIPDEWERAITRWQALNAAQRTEIGGVPAPDANEEYLLYQTLVGTWPLGENGPAAHARYVERIQAYMEKALKEAKIHTSWVSPDADFDRAVATFIGRVLEPRADNEFLADLIAFQARLAPAGLLAALTQTVLKITAPGVPDFYQGSELWDLALVDPDNRRPVDFARRRALLAEVRHAAAADPRDLAARLLARPEDPRLKLFVVARALAFRAAARALFERGAYLPLTVGGARAEHVIAFARTAGDAAAVVLAGRFFRRLGVPERPAVGAVWDDTVVVLDGEGRARRYRDVLTDATVTSAAGGGGEALPLRAAFAHLPVAVLERLP